MNFNTDLFLIGRTGIVDGVCTYFPVFQRDALGNLPHIGSRYVLVGRHMVDFLFQEFGMCQLGSQFPIVSKQQYTRSVTVKTSHRINTFTTNVLDQIHHGLAVLRIVARGHVIFRFVQQDIHLALDAHRLLVELHFIRTFYLRSQLCNHRPVDTHYTCRNKFVRFTTGTNSGIGQELVQTNRSIRIHIEFFILNLFLHAIFGIGVVITGTALLQPASTETVVPIAALRTTETATIIVAIASFTVTVTAFATVTTVVRTETALTVITSFTVTISAFTTIPPIIRTETALAVIASFAVGISTLTIIILTGLIAAIRTLATAVTTLFATETTIFTVVRRPERSSLLCAIGTIGRISPFSPLNPRPHDTAFTSCTI